jgi:MFS family permease
VGSTITFLAVYASRLGASGSQVGFLSAGPAAVNLLLSLPAGRWMEGRSLYRISYLSAAISRIVYPFFCILPWFFTAQLQIWSIILFSLMMSAPAAVLTISFNAVLADVIPPPLRGEVIGRRNALLAISTTFSLIISGQLLNWITFPLNYQLVFAFGTLGAILSTHNIGRVKPIDTPMPRIGHPLRDFSSPGILRYLGAHLRLGGLRFLTRSGGKPLFRPALLRGAYGLFMLSYLVLYTCQYFAIPLFPLFLVNTLKLSDEIISLGNAIFYMVVFMISLRLDWFSRRFGHRRVLIGGAFFMGAYALLLGLAQDAWLYYLASVVGGVVWALVGGALINRLMERVPEDDRPAYMAMHHLVFNLGILSGSLIGPLAGDWLGIRSAILLAVVLRTIAGFLVWAWG